MTANQAAKTRAKACAYLYIRMSTAEQINGDSQRRQIEAGKAYANRCGLDLSDDRIIQDIGVSAFRGDNATDGALGTFIRRAAAGEIASGSYLIVESLDRITRQDLISGVGLLTTILRTDIKIAALSENTVLDRNSDIAPWIMSLVAVGRSNQESMLKSRRVGQAWKNKKDNAKDQRVSVISPLWLKPDANGTHFVAIPERVEIVKNIFELAKNGLGSHAIVSRFNREHIKPFGRGWAKSSVDKILTGRAVLGEYQPHRKNGKTRAPVGDPVKNYYPQVIDEALFNIVQWGRKRRNVKGMGRKGMTYPNLFARIAFCGKCGMPMHYQDKGSSDQNWRYLVCSGKVKGLCDARAWQYDRFERTFLSHVRELDIATLFSDSSRGAERDCLRRQLVEIESEKTRLESGINTLLEMAMNSSTARDHVARKVDESADELKSLRDRQLAIDQRLSQLLAEDQMAQGENSLQPLIDELQTSTEDLQLKRASVAERIRGIVEKIYIHPETQIESLLVMWSNKKVTKTNPKDETHQINKTTLPMFGVKRIDGSVDQYEVVQ